MQDVMEEKKLARLKIDNDAAAPKTLGHGGVERGASIYGTGADDAQPKNISRFGNKHFKSAPTLHWRNTMHFRIEWYSIMVQIFQFEGRGSLPSGQ